MITGDYHLTGIAVARDVGMMKLQGKVIVIDTIPAEPRRTTLSAGRLPSSLAGKPKASSMSQPGLTATVRRSVSFAAHLSDPDRQHADQDQDDQHDAILSIAADTAASISSQKAELSTGQSAAVDQCLHSQQNDFQRRQSMQSQGSIFGRLMSVLWDPGSDPMQPSMAERGESASLPHVTPQSSSLRQMRLGFLEVACVQQQHRAHVVHCITIFDTSHCYTCNA